jgi:hypothetical protein
VRDIAEILPIAVVAVAVIIVFAQLLTSSGAYEQIGRGGLATEEDAPAAGSGDERDDEIRQMLVARNARRVRQGRPALDVEVELARLTRASPAGATSGSGDAVDAELEQEIRDLVIARNARRMRRGQDPLEVEPEVQRQLREL